MKSAINIARAWHQPEYVWGGDAEKLQKMCRALIKIYNLSGAARARCPDSYEEGFADGQDRLLEDIEEILNASSL